MVALLICFRYGNIAFTLKSNINTTKVHVIFLYTDVSISTTRNINVFCLPDSADKNLKKLNVLRVQPKLKVNNNKLRSIVEADLSQTMEELLAISCVYIHYTDRAKSVKKKQINIY